MRKTAVFVLALASVSGAAWATLDPQELTDVQTILACGAEIEQAATDLLGNEALTQEMISTAQQLQQGGHDLTIKMQQILAMGG